MHHSKSYPVTAEVSLPQPHVKYVTETSTNRSSYSGWIAFSLAGAVALTFVLCLNLLGGRSLFLQAVDPIAGLIPIVHQGELQMYPNFEVSQNGIRSHYTSFLPPRNITKIVDSLDKLLESYPKEHDKMYSNCWLENPSPEKPCFFESTWVTDLCTKNYSYGYEEQDGYYNPCFIMKLAKTGDWMPSLTTNVVGHHDPSFLPVFCFIQYPKRLSSPVNISQFPSKGFPRLFFPASKFDDESYLAPLVAVKVFGIKRGDQVTVECSVITPNAFILWNNGRAIITFTST